MDHTARATAAPGSILAGGDKRIAQGEPHADYRRLLLMWAVPATGMLLIAAYLILRVPVSGSPAHELADEPAYPGPARTRATIHAPPDARDRGAAAIIDVGEFTPAPETAAEVNAFDAIAGFESGEGAQSATREPGTSSSPQSSRAPTGGPATPATAGRAASPAGEIEAERDLSATLLDIIHEKEQAPVADEGENRNVMEELIAMIEADVKASQARSSEASATPTAGAVASVQDQLRACPPPNTVEGIECRERICQENPEGHPGCPQAMIRRTE